jgi:hypothetical protein
VTQSIDRWIMSRGSAVSVVINMFVCLFAVNGNATVDGAEQQLVGVGWPSDAREVFQRGAPMSKVVSEEKSYAHAQQQEQDNTNQTRSKLFMAGCERFGVDAQQTVGVAKQYVGKDSITDADQFVSV